MNKQAKHLYEFGQFRLDAAERLLLRDGEVVPLTPKSFDLLLVLVEQPGRLLEKDALLKAVWPDSIVEENNLADNISRLRKTLGEGEDGQKFIETVPRRGYRFLATVTSPGDEPVIPPKLPDPSQQSTNPSRSVMWRIPVILVPLLIAGGLWVDATLKKRAELERLEFKGDFFVSKWKEDEVRKGIAYFDQAIALDPRSSAAHAGLAVGWNFLSDLHIPPREAMPKSKAAVLKALQLDDTNSGAHVSLGVVKMQYDWDWPGAEQEFKRAMALEPGSPPAHRLYGWLLTALGRFEEAHTELNRPLQADPLNDFNLTELGMSYYFARRYEQAIEQFRRSIGIDSKSYWSHMLLGWAYIQQQKFDEAAAECKLAVRINDNPQTVASLGYAYGAAGRRADALAVVEQLVETAQRQYVSPYDVATVYAGLGDKEKALAWLEKAYEHRSGWLALWVKVDPKFDLLRADPRFRDLLRRVGHAPQA